MQGLHLLSLFFFFPSLMWPLNLEKNSGTPRSACLMSAYQSAAPSLLTNSSSPLSASAWVFTPSPAELMPSMMRLYISMFPSSLPLLFGFGSRSAPSLQCPAAPIISAKASAGAAFLAAVASRAFSGVRSTRTKLILASEAAPTGVSKSTLWSLPFPPFETRTKGRDRHSPPPPSRASDIAAPKSAPKLLWGLAATAREPTITLPCELTTSTNIVTGGLLCACRCRPQVGQANFSIALVFMHRPGPAFAAQFSEHGSHILYWQSSRALQ
jgi:hypothetical protein